MSSRNDPAAERWRCFVAVELPDPARAAVIRYLRELRPTVSGVAWTRPESLHLTLAFLGDVPVPVIPDLRLRLATALARSERFAARVVGVGAFPSLVRPQVLWVGVEAPAVGGLAAAVRGACIAAGLPHDDRRFRPHVTIGRVRTRRVGSDLALLARDGERDFGTAEIERVVLYRSQLGAGGARHSPLATFPLGGGAGFP